MDRKRQPKAVLSGRRELKYVKAVRQMRIWREKNITFFIYPLTRTLEHVLYLQANNAL